MNVLFVALLLFSETVSAQTPVDKAEDLVSVILVNPQGKGYIYNGSVRSDGIIVKFIEREKENSRPLNGLGSVYFKAGETTDGFSAAVKMNDGSAASAAIDIWPDPKPKPRCETADCLDPKTPQPKVPDPRDCVGIFCPKEVGGTALIYVRPDIAMPPDLSAVDLHRIMKNEY